FSQLAFKQSRRRTSVRTSSAGNCVAGTGAARPEDPASDLAHDRTAGAGSRADPRVNESGPSVAPGPGSGNRRADLSGHGRKSESDPGRRKVQGAPPETGRVRSAAIRFGPPGAGPQRSQHLGA